VIMQRIAEGPARAAAAPAGPFPKSPYF
jgi:hypothetical protein